MLQAYRLINYRDVLVKAGDYTSTQYWVSFHNIGTGLQSMYNYMASKAFNTNIYDFTYSSKSSALSGITEMDYLTFKLFGTGGDTDTALFVLTDSNMDGFNDITSYVTYDGVGMRLKYKDLNFQSSWDTLDQCGACNSSPYSQQGYFGGMTTTSTQLGGIFVRE